MQKAPAVAGARSTGHGARYAHLRRTRWPGGWPDPAARTFRQLGWEQALRFRRHHPGWQRGRPYEDSSRRAPRA